MPAGSDFVNAQGQASFWRGLSRQRHNFQRWQHSFRAMDAYGPGHKRGRLGGAARPYYLTSSNPASTLHPPLLQPQINDSGSLYYVAGPNLVDIIDVPHGLLRVRFSLKETVANTASPIDSYGWRTARFR